MWLLLVTLTGAAWILADGFDPSSATNNAYISIGLLLLAFFKVRLVIMYFMEVLGAYWVLRAMAEAWVIIVCIVLIAIYLQRSLVL